MKRRVFVAVATIACLCASFAAAFVSTPLASAQGQTECVFAAAPNQAPSPVPTPQPTSTPPSNRAQPNNVEEPDESVALFANARASSVLVAIDCADALAYPGPITNVPPNPRGPYAAPLVLRAAPGAEADTTPASSGAEIAHSGSESFILAYIGTGLVAFGAVALGSRRRLFAE